MTSRDPTAGSALGSTRRPRRAGRPRRAVGGHLPSSREPWIVVAAAMIGNVAVGTGETGPFLTVEQVVVTRDTPRERLTHVLSHYNLPRLRRGRARRLRGRPSHRVTARAVRRLSRRRARSGGVLRVRCESSPLAPPHSGARADAPSRALVQEDSPRSSRSTRSRGGFVLQSLIAYWFYARFGADLADLGWIFFGVQILSGISLAARRAHRAARSGWSTRWCSRT